MPRVAAQLHQAKILMPRGFRRKLKRAVLVMPRVIKQWQVPMAHTPKGKAQNLLTWGVMRVGYTMSVFLAASMKLV